MCLLLILSNKLDLNQETHFTIVPGEPFQPNLMFVGKAKVLPQSTAPEPFLPQLFIPFRSKLKCLSLSVTSIWV